MCRLFGFRSVINSQVHSSLTQTDNALIHQSLQHPDGWGVSYYVQGSPHIIKSDTTAINDNLFKKVSGVVSSQTVLAHVRKATLGEVNILNTHPFQYGKWTFAHNGNIKKFNKHKAEILRLISPELKRFILGNTDSEIVFYYFLSVIQAKINLDEKDIKIDLLADTLKQALKELINIIGDYSKIDDAGNSETYLTFILTNGETMIAHHGGKVLYYSTYKTKCSERDTCPSFTDECENVTKTGFINHLIFASEPLSGENIWIPLKIGELIGVDSKMKLTQFL
ncbi:MAG: class II glutamine amidotransferase [Bacteriovoracaceae bacterium]|jgi:predicted glutamine amidotransferase|nr:class II glutamine amidotransferase [Bacteriovoracaceae bacterium]